jgi:hypothetical protein
VAELVFGEPTVGVLDAPGAQRGVEFGKRARPAGAVTPLVWLPNPTSYARSSNSGVVQMSLAARLTIGLKAERASLGESYTANRSHHERRGWVLAGSYLAPVRILRRTSRSMS